MKFKSVVCVAIVALFAAAVRGQACYAENDGNTYNPAISMGGPNLIVGIKFTVPFSMTVSAAEVFTGNGSDGAFEACIRSGIVARERMNRSRSSRSISQTARLDSLVLNGQQDNRALVTFQQLRFLCTKVR